MVTTSIREIASRFVISVTLIASLLFTLAGCSNDKPDDQREIRYAEFKIALSTMSHLAYANDFTSENGIQLVPISLEAGPDVIASLRSGADSSGIAGNIAIEPVAAMVGAGNDPVILATMLTSSSHVRLVTFEDNGITDDPSTLEGKTVGVVLDTIGETYLLGLLERAGFERSDIRIFNSRPTDLRASLIRGDLDAAILWDPFVAQTQRIYLDGVEAGSVEDRGEFRVFVDPSIFTLRMNVVTTQSKIDGHEAEITDFLSSLMEVEEYLEENPEAAQKQVEDWLGLETGDLDDFFEDTTFFVHFDRAIMEAELDAAVRRLKANDPTTRLPNSYDAYFDQSLLESIAPDRVVQP